jgi:hypothetical protein
MIKFVKHLIVQVMNKYGSFMWFGTHLTMAQVDWHYLLEIFLCVGINFLMIFSIYLEYIEKQNENLQKTDSTK